MHTHFIEVHVFLRDCAKAFKRLMCNHRFPRLNNIYTKIRQQKNKDMLDKKIEKDGLVVY